MMEHLGYTKTNRSMGMDRQVGRKTLWVDREVGDKL